MSLSSTPLVRTKSRPHILVVDDDEQAMKLTREVISRSLHVEVRATSSAEEAARWIRSDPFTLLITDLKMPVFDGLILLRMARRHNPDALTIIVTGHADSENLTRISGSDGPWRIIEKPWKAEVLLASIREALLRVQAAKRQKTILKAMASASTATARPALPAARPPIVLQASGRSAQRPMAGTKPLRLTGKTALPQNVRIPRTASSPTQRARPLPLEQTIGTPLLARRYRLERTIKQGGTGSVYQARDTLLDMPVAIKVLAKEFANQPAALDALKREARIAMQLSHTHIVRLHNLDHFLGRYFLTMEYIDGINLREWLTARGPMNAEQIVQIFQVCADALVYAHRHGVYHRDLKPDNIMIRRDGVVKLIDFGIATHRQMGPLRNQTIEGTPLYMSPEEIKGEPIDGRTDVYSMGVTFHELYTGFLPFPEDAAHVETVRLRRPVFSPALSPALRSGLERAL
ncbi:MAG: protein kinase, partial [Kiritimatiellia bacterium]|nr:protein kinase [Kiritimatiellia bacterium]